MPRSKFIDPKKASHYQLVYKSHEDPSYEDEKTAGVLMKSARVGKRRVRTGYEKNILNEEVKFNMHGEDDAAGLDLGLFDEEDEVDFGQDFIQQMMMPGEGEEDEEEELDDYPRHAPTRDIDQDFEGLLKGEYKAHQMETEKSTRKDRKRTKKRLDKGHPPYPSPPSIFFLFFFFTHRGGDGEASLVFCCSRTQALSTHRLLSSTAIRFVRLLTNTPPHPTRKGTKTKKIQQEKNHRTKKRNHYFCQGLLQFFFRWGFRDVTWVSFSFWSCISKSVSRFARVASKIDPPPP
eukprot:Hpha_TRINITY_DN15798_c2_g13::TRINITY_DN15798_c2_g13_i2::g.40487::m.40487